MAEKILCIHIMVFISELLCPLVQNKHRLEMETCFHRVIRAAISIYNEISIILYKISDHIAAGVAKEEKGKRKPLGRAEGKEVYEHARNEIRKTIPFSSTSSTYIFC